MFCIYVQSRGHCGDGHISMSRLPLWHARSGQFQWNWHCADCLFKQKLKSHILVHHFQFPFNMNLWLLPRDSRKVFYLIDIPWIIMNNLWIFIMYEKPWIYYPRLLLLTLRKNFSIVFYRMLERFCTVLRQHSVALRSPQAWYLRKRVS